VVRGAGRGGIGSGERRAAPGGEGERRLWGGEEEMVDEDGWKDCDAILRKEKGGFAKMSAGVPPRVP